MKGQTKGPGRILARIVVSVTALLVGCAPSMSLNQAIQGDHINRVKAFLAHGTNPNMTLDGYGNTPLILAVNKGQTDLAKLLLAHGANPNAKNYLADPPLIFAAARGSADMVRLLIANKANPHARSKSGYTAILMSISNGHIGVVKILLKHGARMPDIRQLMVGIQIAPALGTVLVQGVLPRGPAEQAGIEKGDEVSRVDGKSTSGMNPPQFLHALRGAPGTPVELTIIRNQGTSAIESKDVTLVRELIPNVRKVLFSLYSGSIKQRALLARKEGKYTAALQDYLSLLSMIPHRSGREFKDIFQHVIASARQVRPLPPTPESYRREMIVGLADVRKARTRVDYLRALQHFKRASVMVPWAPQPYEAMGHIQESLKDYGAALRSFRLYLLANPKGSDARALQDHVYILEEEAKTQQ